MEDKQYFALPYISSTSLHWFDKHPLYFKKKLDNEIEESKESYFQIGEQIHLYFLEREEFDKKYVFLDYESPSTEQQKIFCNSLIETDDLIESYKKAYSAKSKSDKKITEEATKLKDKFNDYIESIRISSNDKIVLSNSMNSLLSALDNSIQDHKLANKLLFTKNSDTYLTFNEKVILWKFDKDYPQCKSKIDRFIIDKKNKKVILVDIKTTANIYEFDDSINKFNYKRQLAFYWNAIYKFITTEYKNINLSEYSQETYHIVLQKNSQLPIVEVIKFDFNDLTIVYETNEIKLKLNEINWHIQEDKWEHSRSYYINNGIDIIIK